MNRNLNNVFKLIDDNKKKFFIFIIFIFFGSILEAFGVGLIIPIISSIVDFENNIIFQYFPNNIKIYFLNFEKRTFILILCLLAGLFYLFKNIYLSILNFYLQKFLWEMKNKIEKKIYESYLSIQYSEFIKVPLSKRINNINIETQNVLEGSLTAIFAIFSETLLIFSLIVLLLLYNFKITILSFGALLFSALFFILIIKPFFKKWGKIRSIYSQKKIEILTQTLGGIREIKLFDLISLSIENFKKNNNQLTSVSYLQTSIQQITKFYLEICAVISFIVVVFYFTEESSSFSKLVTLISLYGLSTFRMLPSINKLINAKNSLKYSELPTSKILNDLKNIENINFISMRNNNENSNDIKKWKKIKLTNISFKYNVNENYVLKNLNIEILRGNKIGIKGKSGCGKSTLIDIVCNLIRPTDGHIYIDGKNLNLKQEYYYQHLFSYISQNPFIFNASIKDNICLNLGSKKIDINKDILQKAIYVSQLTEFINQSKDKEENIIGEEGNRLSGGQKQRIAIARTLYSNKDIFIFDEATNALDDELEKNLIDLLLKNYSDKTIIFISHNEKNLKKLDETFDLIDGSLKLL